ncbi:MAG: amino acid adenylation domain-containing protein [Beijerinckiaceae bacterium]|nr:amino acid adenylation domain-containing protein [Beijerinckiaceae bacterium]
MIGFFVNTLVLRTDLSGDPPFIELLRRVREIVLGALAHQDLPFERLVQELSPKRDLGHTPFFQVMFGMENAPRGQVELGSLAVTQVPLDTKTAIFDLTLNIANERDGWVAELEYNSDLFGAATIHRMAGHISCLLDGIAATPEARLSDLPLLTEGERGQVLEWGVASAGDFGQQSLGREVAGQLGTDFTSIAEHFAEQAARTPDAIAVVCEGEALNYAELNRRANRLARHLRSLGVGPDDLVGLCVERSLDMAIGILGILKAGSAYLPLDPVYPKDRLAFMIEDAGAPVLLTQEQLLSALPEVSSAILCLDRDASLWESEPDGELPQSGSPATLAYVIYTSGSTGRPKGVVVTQGNLSNLVHAQARAFGLTAADRVLQFSSISFDQAAEEIFPTWLSGAALVLFPRSIHESLVDFMDFVRGAELTVLDLPTAFWHYLTSDLTDTGKPLPPSLRLVVVGGEKASAEALRVWRSLASDKIAWMNSYGPTETTVVSTSFALTGNSGDLQDVPIGRPIDNTSAYILDLNLEPAPIGVPGELYIGGSGVSRGYLHRPDLTAGRFIPDPFGEADGRLYRTCDLARWRQDGNIEYLGRIDHQVKLRGYRIELGEIEAALAALDGVRQAVVLLREDKPSQKLLAAYVVPAAGSGFDLAALRHALAKSLPNYMVPSAFVRLDALPLTRNGKIDRKALPAPDFDAPVRDRYGAPCNPIEETLCRIWAQTLGRERVGIEDNFFELGGHSLLAVTLIERMRREGLKADVRSLFSSPTPAGLAAAIGCAGEAVIPPNLIPLDCAAIHPEMLPLVELSQAEIDMIVETVQGGARDVQDIYPLAPLQEGILFHHLLAAKGDPYLLPTLLEFDTRKRLERFLMALQAAIARHDILRTAVVWEGLPEPVQVVWRAAPLIVEDVTLDPADGDIGEQLRARFDPRQVRLDVRQAPLLRGYRAHDTAKDRWLLLLLAHHLVSDHTTLEILVEEAQAQLLGHKDKLPPPLPFRNFVAQARLDVSRSEHEAFFQKMLSDVTETTAPFGLLDVQGDGSRTEEARLDLDPGLARRLREQARALRVSPASLCHLAFALVLARVTGRHDVVFGTVLLGRMHASAGVNRALGMFINTLPLRIRVDELGVADSVQRTHRLLVELLKHEHASLALAQRCSVIPAPAPLFSAILNYRHSQDGAETSGDAALAWEGIETLYVDERTNYPFDLSVDDLGEGFRLTGQAQRPLEPERLCNFMRSALESLVSELETAPGREARAIDVLPEDERCQLVAGWNATAEDYPKDRCVHEQFAAQAARTPDAIAVICEGEALSYSELNQRANRLAWHLRSLGVGPDVLVGLCVERSFDMVVGILGILKAGGAYLPLDPAYPKDRLGFMIEDTGAPVLLTQERLLPALSETAARVLCLDRDAPIWDLAPDGELPPPVCPANLAYVIYTSGSTGTPKGVMVTHASLCNLVHAQAQAYGLTAADRALQFSSISFDQAAEEIFATWLGGAALVLLPRNIRESLVDFMDFVSDLELTVLDLPTAFWHHLTSDLTETGEPLPPNLRLLIVGGEKASAETLRSWRALATDKITWLNAYGPTETTVTAATFRLTGDCGDLIEVPIGRPIANTKAYVLNSNLEPAPIGVPGELYIGGSGVSRGYLGRPGLTAERFIPDPFGEGGGRLYRSGDLARWRPDGNIEYLGRIDHQVKLRGYRIELGEIESALIALDGVRQAAVLLRENRPGQKQLTTYFVSAPGASIDPAGLRQELARSLPDYMIPSAFIQLDALPLSQNGKIDRRALPVPETDANTLACFRAPRTAVEEILAGIWADVLGRERVGIDENFFEIGGHSLTAIQVISRIRRTLCAGLTLRSLFEAPTVAELAHFCPPAGGRAPAKQTGRAPERPLTARRRETPIPLSFAQQRFWFLDQLEPSSSFYNMPLALRLIGPLDLAGLTQALRDAVRRHEILRTSFPLVNGQAAQMIAPELAIDLPVIGVTAPDQAGELRRLLSAEAAKPFDLAAGPLIRGCVFELGMPEADNLCEHALLLTLHHSIADGWSMGILLRELAERYENYVASRSTPLDELAVQYADFTLWQREFLSEEELDRQLSYWRARLAGAPPILGLPIDRPRPRVQSYAGGNFSTKLSLDLTEGLHKLVRRHGATLFMGLLAAFQLLLSRHSGQKDICVGTPVANRRTVETEGLIGCFVNMLVIRTGLSGNPRFTELLARVREAVLEAQEHQDLPFEQLVTELKLSRELGHNPLFQAAFAMDNTPAPKVEAAGLIIEAIDIGTETAMFDLSVDIADAADGILINFEYNADLFDRSTIERLAAHYPVLLESIAAEPDARIGDLPMLPEPERCMLLAMARGSAGSSLSAQQAREFKSVVALVEESVARVPDRTALVDSDTRLTYRELNIRANRLAHRLISLGAGPESVIGVHAERSIELAVALLAVLKTGGSYLPLDPAYPRSRLRAMLEESTPAILLSQGLLPGELAGVCPVLDLQGDAHPGYPDTNPAVTIGADTLAYILFTSGSTGRPKGVMVTHRALANRVIWGVEEFALSPDDVVLARTSPSFDVSAWEIFGGLAAGSCLAIAGPGAADPERLVDLIVRHSVTAIEVVPSLLRELMLMPAWRNCKTLRLVCCGGEALSDALRAEFYASPRGCKLYNMYGPTEATVDAAHFACGDFRGARAIGGVPLGRPILNTRIYVLDQHLNLVPSGVTGEIYIGGAGLARGYLRQPALTAGRFIPDPFGEVGERLYRTGDLARWRPDGNIEYLGRSDHQVKIRGYRIELEEIEARVMELPGVAAAAATVQTDARGENRLVAYVATQDETITPAVLRRHALSVLPDFMLPAVWTLMAVLPCDENGKLRRAALPPLPRACGQHKTSISREAASSVPATDTEVTLARVFADVLGLSAVGRHDGFFELGGHSLLAVQLALQLRDALGADIPLVALFQYPTVAALAEWLQLERKVTASPLVAVRAGEGVRSPLYLLHTGTGHVRGYQPLISALDPGIPIHGIQLRALENSAIAAQDFGTVVRDYAEILCTRHPGGPYRLLGWSLGGLIALGVAARLQALGANIGFLGLVDTDLPQKPDEHDWKRRLAEYLPGPEERASLATLPARDLLELEKSLAGVPSQDRPASAALWGHEKGLWFSQLPVGVFRLETSLWRHFDAIEDSFEAPRFDGDIHLWWAKDSLGDIGVPSVDWARLTGAKCHEKIIEGDHGTIMASPELHSSIRDVLAVIDG